jgi:spore maturation protein CgeB
MRLPANTQHMAHIPPAEHADFYGGQRYTLNLTRAEMISAGFSPSVRMFEAAACGVAIISDSWPGVENFFAPGTEILLAESSLQVVQIIEQIPEEQRRSIAAAARRRLLANHTPQHRAKQVEDYYREVLTARRSRLFVEELA